MTGHSAASDTSATGALITTTTEDVPSVDSLTIQEKASLLTGASGWTTAGVPRLGIRSVSLADGPHGVRRVADIDSLDMAHAIPATCFPTASALASSWDPKLVRSLGVAIGTEARALGVDVILGPGINIKRSPLCGRNFEYYSEDPFLAGELAIGHVEGIQSMGVGACVKHFAVNNQETRRFTVDAVVDQRTLEEIYLPAFEAVVTRAQPWTVMCSYNSVNGDLASQNRYLLTTILRERWGFDGLVMSDWGAVRDRVAALAAGLDLEMPGPREHRVQKVVEAIDTGVLPKSTLDRSATRVMRLGRLVDQVGEVVIDEAAHHELAQRAAAESMVLLKNDGVLPIHPASHLAVIGHAARVPHFQGAGSSHITPTRIDEPLAEITSAADGSVTWAQGYPTGPEHRDDLIAEAVEAAAAADVAIIFAMLPSWKEAEGADRNDIDLPPQQIELIRAVTAAQPRTVVVANNGSAIAVADWIDGTAALLEAWLMGQGGGRAVADILFGRVNPSGKLAETFPIHLEDTPAYLSFPGEGDSVVYGEGIFVGYRWYDARSLHVQFPFGHGLSYTTFEYSNLRVSSTTLSHDQEVDVLVDVTNTGPVAGSEVVQVYVRPHSADVPRPEQELKGFTKVAVAPGETVTAAVRLPSRSFAHFLPGTGWVVDPGEFDVRVGASSRDIRDSATIAVTDASPRLPTIARHSPLSDWLADPDGRAIAEALLTELEPALAAALGSEEGHPERVSPLAMTMLAAMPLPTIVDFAGTDGPPGGDVVDDLIDRLRLATTTVSTNSAKESAR